MIAGQRQKLDRLPLLEFCINYHMKDHFGDKIKFEITEVAPDKYQLIWHRGNGSWYQGSEMSSTFEGSLGDFDRYLLLCNYNAFDAATFNLDVNPLDKYKDRYWKPQIWIEHKEVIKEYKKLCRENKCSTIKGMEIRETREKLIIVLQV